MQLRLAKLGLVLAVAIMGATLTIPVHAQAASAAEAAAMVKARTKGRVLGVRTVETQGRRTYRVKVLTSKGVMRTVNVQHRSR
ncbi:MAG: hypothetical protein AAF458_20295 [Pseudomonadota bacterium]